MILRFQNMLFTIKFLIKQEPQKYQENSARLFFRQVSHKPSSKISALGLNPKEL